MTDPMHSWSIGIALVLAIMASAIAGVYVKLFVAVGAIMLGSFALLRRVHQQNLGSSKQKGLDLRLVPSSAVVRSDPGLLERIFDAPRRAAGPSKPNASAHAI